MLCRTVSCENSISKTKTSHNQQIEGIGGFMRYDPKMGLDATDWNLLNLLRQEARLSFAELGRKLQLSAPAVAERMVMLATAGVT